MFPSPSRSQSYMYTYENIFNQKTFVLICFKGFTKGLCQNDAPSFTYCSAGFSLNFSRKALPHTYVCVFSRVKKCLATFIAMFSSFFLFETVKVFLKRNSFRKLTTYVGLVTLCDYAISGRVFLRINQIFNAN